MTPHHLLDCFAVWYQRALTGEDLLDHADEICEQGWADYKLDGINKADARRARGRKR